MSTRTILCRAFAFLVALFVSTSAHAVFRAYLASDGSDANPCTLAQPCRLLPAALTAVDAGGEIWLLDSANYNTATVTIGKSVSILAVPGAVGSVVATGGGPAISITAASLKVALRNLVIVPLPGGPSTDAVSMTGASSLTIERCLIANLADHGVFVQGTGTVRVADTIIRNIGVWAVFLLDGATAKISRTQMLGNGYGGLSATSTTATTTTASVSDSVISGGNLGVYAAPDIAGAVAKIFMTRSTIEGTTFALDSQTGGVGSALITVSYSMVTNNYYAWYQSGAGSVIKTLGNNHFEDNTSTVGSLTTAALQ